MLLQCKAAVNVNAGWEVPPFCTAYSNSLELIATLDGGSVHAAGSKTSRRADTFYAI